MIKYLMVALIALTLAGCVSVVVVTDDVDSLNNVVHGKSCPCGKKCPCPKDVKTVK